MVIVDIAEARIQLSQLVDQAVQGKSFLIAKAGKPLVKVSAFDAPAVRRLGFLKGAIRIPADFNTMGGVTLLTSDATLARYRGPVKKV